MILCVPALFAQVEPNAGKWRTWVLPSAAQVRLPAPPNASESAAEIQTLKSLIKESTPDVKAQIAYWDSGSPGYRWIQLGSQQLLAQNVAPTLYTRAMAMLSVAIYDATVAAWDSKFAYNRPRPSAPDAGIQALVSVSSNPSYPSEHAVAAGAASVVLAYLLPNMGETYADLAEEAARSRLYAGAAYPSDVTAGLQLGRQVGLMVIAHAQADGSTATFTGSFPPAPGLWSSATPVTPLAGNWTPWVLSSGSDFRLAPPPASGSPENDALVAGVKNFVRTNSSNHSAWFWQPSFAVPWLDALNREIFENHLDGNAPRAARAYALETIAQHDATIACWDTKYAYLEMRPSMADPSIVPLFANPQHPGFPSGHACASGSSAAVIGYLFPSDAQAFAAMAVDAGTSTFDAAIHNSFDVSQGLALGTKVGQAVVDRARTDGAP
ncbi:MAG: phosphoesterase, PA-phosphatase related [Bryobacterales bacterium]|nr:phosphoesterase, PA-phosphatase related [Bryobacterales bacterium]